MTLEKPASELSIISARKDAPTQISTGYRSTIRIYIAYLRYVLNPTHAAAYVYFYIRLCILRAVCVLFAFQVGITVESFLVKPEEATRFFVSELSFTKGRLHVPAQPRDQCVSCKL